MTPPIAAMATTATAAITRGMSEPLLALLFGLTLREATAPGEIVAGEINSSGLGSSVTTGNEVSGKAVSCAATGCGAAAGLGVGSGLATGIALRTAEAAGLVPSSFAFSLLSYCCFFSGI